jgi:hypothetical protein
MSMDWGESLSTYLALARATVLERLRDRDTDIAKGLDPAVVTVENPQTDFIRWGSANARWERYNGTAWVQLASTYAITVTIANAVPANAISNAMIRASGACSVIGRAADSNGDVADIAIGADQVLGRAGSGNLASITLGTNHYGNNTVTYGKVQQAGAFSVLGRATGTTGNLADIAIGADQVLGRAGSGNLASITLGPNHYGNQTITFGKIAAMNGARLLGRGSASAGSPEEITVGSGLTLSGTTLSNASPGESNTGANIGTGPGQPFHSKSGATLQFRNIAGSVTAGGTIDVAHDANNNIVIGYSAPGGTDSLHPDSLVEMADGGSKWLRDVRVGEFVRGRHGPAEVLGIWTSVLAARPLYEINGSVVCTPGHLFPTPDGWGAPSPQGYRDHSHGRRRAVKGKRGMIETECLLADPDKVVEIVPGVQILAADGWVPVTSVRQFAVSGPDQRIMPQQPVIALLLDGSDIFFADGYAVGTLA